ncbi:hypothetical protein HAX54_001409 [Datura stramonium]|uniref:Uncharacterized protein n=1 Tax=Datura stramonium TaxID=4076 RepID=A0ABS8T2B8_DATST|nr:hypothetical protein [Datura stramonium]
MHSLVVRVIPCPKARAAGTNTFFLDYMRLPMAGSWTQVQRSPCLLGKEERQKQIITVDHTRTQIMLQLTVDIKWAGQARPWWSSSLLEKLYTPAIEYNQCITVAPSHKCHPITLEQKAIFVVSSELTTRKNIRMILGSASGFLVNPHWHRHESYSPVSGNMMVTACDLVGSCNVCLGLVAAISVSMHGTYHCSDMLDATHSPVRIWWSISTIGDIWSWFDRIENRSS